MASRTSSPARPSRPAPKTRRPAAAARPKATRTAPARRPVRPGPVPRFVAAIGRLLRGLWFGLAHLLGAAARAMGRGARDLDPAHRRDGLGLALVAGAATLVAATWFGVDGWFVSWTDMVMTSLIGALAWVSPLILLGLAWRFLRHPDDNATTGRLVIGASAVLVGRHRPVAPGHGLGDPERRRGGHVGRRRRHRLDRHRSDRRGGRPDRGRPRAGPAAGLRRDGPDGDVDRLRARGLAQGRPRRGGPGAP